MESMGQRTVLGKDKPMIVPRKEIEDIAAGPEGYSRQKVEQVCGMLRLLERIQEEDELRDRLALKGGTAINFFLLDRIARLSVDLDLDYIAPRETLKEAMRSAGEHEKLFKKIAADLGMRIVKYIPPRDKNRVATTRFAFDSSDSGEITVECDISYYQRQTIFGEKTIPFIGFGEGIDYFKDLEARVVNPADVWGSKIVALVWMNESDIFPSEHVAETDVRYRHLFDVWKLAKLKEAGMISPIDFARIKTAFTVWGPPRDFLFPDRMGEVINQIEFEKNIEVKLYDFLPVSLKRPRFEDMKRKVRSKILSKIYDRDERGDEYVCKFVEGNYIPELIFGETDYYLMERMKNCSYLKETSRELSRKKEEIKKAREKARKQ